MQSVKNALGITEETTPEAKTMEDNQLMMDAEGQPAELTSIKDSKEGGGTKEGAQFMESTSSNTSGIVTTNSEVHGTNEDDSSTEDIPEDDIEYKLTDLVGESNMSTLPKPCKRPGDMVVVIPCPEHEVDLEANRGFFIMDMTTIGKKTERLYQEKRSLEDAIEEAEKPLEFLCPEEEGQLHTTRSDRSCKSHPDNSSTGNIVRTLLMTYRALKRSTKRGSKCGDVPTIIMKELFQEKPVIPVSINTALIFNTLQRGGGEYSDKERECLPHYAAIIFEKMLKKIKSRNVSLAPILDHTPTLATRVIDNLRADTVNTLYNTAKQLNDKLNRNYKRKCRDLNINIESLKKKPHYSQAAPPKDHGLKIDPKWTDIILTCPSVKTRFAKQTVGGVESFGIFFETQLARSYDDKMLCKICVGPREPPHAG